MASNRGSLATSAAALRARDVPEDDRLDRALPERDDEPEPLDRVLPDRELAERELPEREPVDRDPLEREPLDREPEPELDRDDPLDDLLEPDDFRDEEPLERELPEVDRDPPPLEDERERLLPELDDPLDPDELEPEDADDPLEPEDPLEPDDPLSALEALLRGCGIFPPYLPTAVEKQPCATAHITESAIANRLRAANCI